MQNTYVHIVGCNSCSYFCSYTRHTEYIEYQMDSYYYHYYNLANSFPTRSTIIFAIARLEVAPGEGALRTCSTLLPKSPSPESNTKSSTSVPSGLMA